jgi:phosphate starvation-inducible PhoH-like protein
MPRDSVNEDFFDTPRRTTNRAGRKAAARQERKTQKATKLFVSKSEPLIPRNENQGDYLAALNESDQVFGIGPAGTGKTYMAARVGIRSVMDGRKDKICIARVTIAKKKHALGFRHGNQNDKIADWVVPIMDGFKAECSKTTIEAMVKSGKIEFLAFETLRGRSLENCFVLLDEAQNCDLDDLKLFLTRIGEATTVVVCGDPSQTDIPDSGLEKVLDMIDDYDIDADVVEFTEDDVVRSATAKAWVKAFSALT